MQAENDTEPAYRACDLVTHELIDLGYRPGDRAGEFRELDAHASREDILYHCHAWEGQHHE